MNRNTWIFIRGRIDVYVTVDELINKVHELGYIVVNLCDIVTFYKPNMFMWVEVTNVAKPCIRTESPVKETYFGLNAMLRVLNLATRGLSRWTIVDTIRDMYTIVHDEKLREVLAKIERAIFDTAGCNHIWSIDVAENEIVIECADRYATTVRFLITCDIYEPESVTYIMTELNKLCKTLRAQRISFDLVRSM